MAKSSIGPRSGDDAIRMEISETMTMRLSEMAREAPSSSVDRVGVLGDWRVLFRGDWGTTVNVPLLTVHHPFVESNKDGDLGNRS